MGRAASFSEEKPTKNKSITFHDAVDHAQQQGQIKKYEENTTVPQLGEASIGRGLSPDKSTTVCAAYSSAGMNFMYLVFQNAPPFFPPSFLAPRIFLQLEFRGDGDRTYIYIYSTGAGESLVFGISCLQDQRTADTRGCDQVCTTASARFLCGITQNSMLFQEFCAHTRAHRCTSTGGLLFSDPP